MPDPWNRQAFLAMFEAGPMIDLMGIKGHWILIYRELHSQ